MTEITTLRLRSALPPTEAELAAWHALSREEQLARYREALQAADAGGAGKATMADVLAAARTSWFDAPTTGRQRGWATNLRPIRTFSRHTRLIRPPGTFATTLTSTRGKHLRISEV